jgi:hypothetical protein
MHAPAPRTHCVAVVLQWTPEAQQAQKAHTHVFGELSLAIQPIQALPTSRGLLQRYRFVCRGGRYGEHFSRTTTTTTTTTTKTATTTRVGGMQTQTRTQAYASARELTFVIVFLVLCFCVFVVFFSSLFFFFFFGR